MSRTHRGRTVVVALALIGATIGVPAGAAARPVPHLRAASTAQAVHAPTVHGARPFGRMFV